RHVSCEPAARGRTFSVRRAWEAKGMDRITMDGRSLPERIGEVAGRVWRQLRAHGSQSTRELAHAIGRAEPDVHQAIGWLAREGARNLAAAGATVVLPCRSLERGEASRAEISRDVPGAKIELAKGDLSSQASLRALAAELLRAHARIDVLVNNAGVSNTKR